MTPPPPTHTRYPYFDLVVGLVWSNDPDSYAGGSAATGRASYIRLAKGDYLDEMGCLVL